MRRLAITILLSTFFIMITDAQTDSTTLKFKGDIAPGFTCITIDGKSFNLEKMRGKIVLINFFATWCPPCNKELPVLQKNIWEKYRTNDKFALIILGREHNESVVSEFVKSKGFSMPFAPDPDRKIYSLYATQYIPRNVLVDTDGRILFQSRGFEEAEFAEIEKIISEKLK